MQLKHPHKLTGITAHGVAPSNIALVKYWGKRSPLEQWPANDSLSMTLTHARTETWAQLATDGIQRVSLLGGQFSSVQEAKVQRHLDVLRKDSGFDVPLHVETWNSFPASAGIASSASGFAALSITALAAWTGATSMHHLAECGFGRDRIAKLARLGSGSACRSLYGGYVRWSAGDNPLSQRVEAINPNEHWELSDLIVILSDKPKEVGSTEAHAYAASSALFAPRLAGLGERLALVERAIRNKDFAAMGREIEAEALEMHAVMMTATPSVCYVSLASQRLLVALRQARRMHGLPAYFTMDAGPNVHVICESKDQKSVLETLHSLVKNVMEELPFSILEDQIGSGPTVSRVEV